MLRKMKMPPALVALLLLLTLTSSSLGASITLSSAKDFTEFVGNVNSGSTYSGTTVYLGSDITLSGSIDPIGISYNYYFSGVFDGQGHVISNLAISSTLIFAGLFGYSGGMTIRNAVLDSSCSIESKSSGSDYVHVGGIIGKCSTYDDQCNIENIVNMAGVTFSGSTSNSYHLFVGGIVGALYSFSSYSAYLKNCVNYGSVTDSGTVSGSDTWAELGGIIGISDGESSSPYKYIQNCLNYGAIIHNGESSNLDIGGIVGNAYIFTYVENCVSAGKISIQTEPSYRNIGSIVADVHSITYINYCYYTSDVGVSSLYEYGTPSIIGTPDSPTGVDSELVNKLNINATSCNWNKWFTLHLNGGSINNLKQESLIEIQGQIPNPVKEGNSFMFWCKDAECTEEFDPATESVSGITDLYAAWTKNIVTFDFDNGTTVNETFAYNTEITYPDVKKEGYTLSWNNYHKFMPARGITITAVWTPNNYIVSFDFDNGTTVNETFAYNTEITYPDVKKEGYTLSWSNYHEFTPAKNITITAVWTPNNYTVTFDFDNGTTVNETFAYNTEIIYPDIKKEGYTLSWSNYHEFTPAKNITITAVWTPNIYTVTFDFDNGTTVNETFSYNTEIMYPNNLPEKEGYTLSWDNYHEFMPAGDITVTAQWTPNNYTVTFDFGNGTTVNVSFAYNTEIIYLEEEGHTLSWDNYHEFMPAKNITVTAQWTPINYTVTFDANGGSISETSKIATFNEKYGNLPEPKKEGYMFIGWFTNEANGTEVTNETFVTTPYNHILYAHWEEVTTQVEIVFSTKDLTEKDIEEIIKQYTRADFDIVKVEGEPGETRVIIKFTDTQSAEEFVRKVRESRSTGVDMIKRVGFTSEDDNSFSPMLYPTLLFNALLL